MQPTTFFDNMKTSHVPKPVSGIRMSTSKSQIAGWVLSSLLCLMLCGPSAMSKFFDWEGKAKEFERIGFTTDLMFNIGILEAS